MICKAKNKAELQSKLNTGDVVISEPTPFGTKYHNSSALEEGFKEPVVLDPETRRRFATIEKTASGWKVK